MDTHKYIITAHSAAAAAAALQRRRTTKNRRHSRRSRPEYLIGRAASRAGFPREERTRARLARINGTGFVGRIGDEIATRARARARVGIDKSTSRNDQGWSFEIRGGSVRRSFVLGRIRSKVESMRECSCTRTAKRRKLKLGIRGNRTNRSYRESR